MPRQPVVVPAASANASARRPTRPVSFLPNPAPSAPVAAGAPPRRGATASTAEAPAGDPTVPPTVPPTVALIPATLPAPSAPASPARLLEQAQAAFNRGAPAEAVRRAREALAAGGSPLAAHLLLGDVYYHMERYADALREYQAALKLDPDNPIANRGRQLALRQVDPATE
jgi:tetratricopeptide (TPR) repeat protein